MDKTYQKFLQLGISLAAVGIESGALEMTYFCTPKGASIIGWAGVGGVHYCRIRGFGSMVFVVNPANTAPDYVHPVAEDFEALLRLLLACGDEAALEQAWQWNEEQFNAYLDKYPPTEGQKAALSEISEKMKLLPINNPWQYLYSLHVNFDYSKIKYTDDISDPDMNVDAQVNAPEWKVFFDGSFWDSFWGCQGRDRAGIEISIGMQFEWAGRHWLIPAVYSCSKGLVADFCMRADAEEIRALMKCFNFNPSLELNGRRMQTSHGCSVSFNPCLPEGMVNESEAKWAVSHYDLDASYVWVIYRNAFSWNSKRRPEIKTLSLTMQQQPGQIPGPHFKIHAPGDSFRFIHPVSRTEYMLTVQELEQQTVPEKGFGSEQWIYPKHYTAMSYTLLPETKEQITISDCEDNDKPVKRKIPENSFAPAAGDSAFCIGVIGGADRPATTIFGGSKQGKLCATCSALHFEPVRHDMEWRITFHEKRFDDFTLILI